LSFQTGITDSLTLESSCNLFDGFAKSFESGSYAVLQFPKQQKSASPKKSSKTKAKNAEQRYCIA
jgi:hypothetical protein